MSNTPVVPISHARARAQRRMRDLAQAARGAAYAAAHPEIDGSAFPDTPRGGRAWLNGQQLGGVDESRLGHLTRAYE